MDQDELAEVERLKAWADCVLRRLGSTGERVRRRREAIVAFRFHGLKLAMDEGVGEWALHLGATVDGLGRAIDALYELPLADGDSVETLRDTLFCFRLASRWFERAALADLRGDRDGANGLVVAGLVDLYDWGCNQRLRGLVHLATGERPNAGTLASDKSEVQRAIMACVAELDHDA